MAQHFEEDPSEEAFHRLTKDELLEVADIFKIKVSATEKRLKHTIKSVLLPFLIEKGILPRVDMREAVRLKELSVREKELDNEREVIWLKVAENQLQLRELEFKARTDNLDLATTGDSFDASRHIRLVPPFVEKDVERYFPHFEKVALTLKWPKDVWPRKIKARKAPQESSLSLYLCFSLSLSHSISVSLFPSLSLHLCFSLSFCLSISLSFPSLHLSLSLFLSLSISLSFPSLSLSLSLSCPSSSSLPRLLSL